MTCGKFRLIHMTRAVALCAVLAMAVTLAHASAAPPRRLRCNMTCRSRGPWFPHGSPYAHRPASGTGHHSRTTWAAGPYTFLASSPWQ